MVNKFSNIIKALRTDRDVNQTALAKALGTTQRKVSYWENGATEPDLDTLIQIADYFDISVDVLIGRKEY
ncbi:MAG: helix-turn-helix domain-containing protein [Clostridiales bacterium]|jgi:transcriptional regulator with XRE-family HTH domain|nr:helix-turn-helix domain-containing protein [Clostridiales bacterium]